MTQSLIQIVDAALASAVERSGPHLVCRPGCTQCCHGVFPISQQDADRLRQGLQLLRRHDSLRADRIIARVDQSFARIHSLFPGDQATGILRDNYEESPLFADESDESIGNSEPCPVLDPLTGTCDLYEHRPIVCRTFGPPIRTPEGDLAACELCYTNASTPQIAACELDPAIPEQERASNEAFDIAHHTHGETIVTYAISKR